MSIRRRATMYNVHVSGWSISQKSSPLKLLCQMNINLVGSIYGRSSIKIAHFVLIRKQTNDLHRQIMFLIGQFVKIFFSETPWPNKATFYRKHLWKVLYKIFSFHLYWTKTWLPWATLVSDWRKFLFFSLKPLGQMNRNLVGNIYGRSPIPLLLRYQKRKSLIISCQSSFGLSMKDEDCHLLLL